MKYTNVILFYVKEQKMKPKRFSKNLSFFLSAVILVVSMFAGITAFAEQSDDYEYEILSEDTCAITAYNGNETDWIIPNEIDGHTVVSIGSKDETGDFSLSNKNALKTVTIPAGLEYICESAFEDCTNLETFEVADGNSCYSAQDGVLFNSEKTQLIKYPQGKKDTSYSVPEGVTNIAEWAFAFCSNLQSVTLPNSMTELSDYSFLNCYGLTDITIPESITRIGIFSLSHTALADVTLPESVTDIDGAAFYFCEELKNVTVLNRSADLSFGENIFDNSTVESITGYKGSGAEDLAEFYGLEFITLGFNTLEDENTGTIISGDTEDSIPENTELNVTITEQTETSVKYNITLVADGNEIQPANSVTVKIPVPETLDPETCAVYRMEADGTRTDMNAVYKNGYMVFSTDHFSEYVLTGELINAGKTDEPSDPSQSEEQTNSAGQNQNASGNSNTNGSGANTSKVQSVSIPDTGAKEQNGMVVYFIIAAGCTLIFLAAVCISAKKKSARYN